MQTSRIVVAHPHRVVADALAESLRGNGIEIVGSTTSVGELVELVRDGRPDVAVVDLDDLQRRRPSLIADLKTLVPDLVVLVVATAADRLSVEQTLSGGADGFTLTTTTLPEFREAVHRVAAGEVVLHPSVASMLVQSINDFSRGRRVPASSLTPRQEEILQLIAFGLPNKRIARRLGIGVETVKTHVSRIMEKFDVGSRTEVVVRAVREGILSPALLGEDPDGDSEADRVLGAG